MDAMGKQDELEAAKAELAAIRAELGNVGLLSHGYVQDRGPGAGGPCYQWTRKVKAKTVSVALSREQFIAMAQAIANWKALKARLVRDDARHPPRQAPDKSDPGPRKTSPIALS